METLQLRKSVFPTPRPDVQMLESELLAQKLKVWYMFGHHQGTARSLSSSPEEVWTTQQTQRSVGSYLQRSLDAEVKITDGGTFLWNRPDARVASLDAV